MQPPPLVDALSLRIFDNLFSSIAEDMGVTLQRAAYSPNITMRRDYSCALFDAQGRLLAQAAHMPVHLGAMPMAMLAVRRAHALRPGDVVILNDPYDGGTHLPDISLVSAAFDHTGQLLGYVMSRAHHADVGGMSPGSMPLSSDIHGEGIIIPPTLLMSAGKIREDVMSLLLHNVRTPIERRGDLEAQLASQHIGEDGLSSLVDRYCNATLTAHGEALQSYAESMMRATICTIPTGEYRATDYLDDDGRTDERLPITVTLRRGEDSSDLEIDFAGTAMQRSGPINAPLAVTISATLYVLRCLQGEDVPVNDGSLRPLRIIAPEGTIVSARYPAAVAGGNVETSQRIVDTLFAALALAVPTAVPAASQGTMNNLAIGGFDGERNRHFAYYETMGGGCGGRPAVDGASAVHDHMSNTMNTPVEVLEAEYPLRVTRYSLRARSGGDGLHPGGRGLQRDFEFLSPTTVTLLTERRITAPYGLHGGTNGAIGENVWHHNGTADRLAGKSQFNAEASDLLSVKTPGGGGFGELKGTETGC